MAFASVDDIVAALCASTCQRISMTFPSFTTVAGRLSDVNAGGAGRWGQMPTPTAASSGGKLHAAGDTGFPPLNAPGGSAEQRILVASFGCQNQPVLYLYERVWSCSGFDGTLSTAQAVTSFPSLTIPDANGTGLELFAEIYTQIGATGVNVTASYTNSANTSGRTSQSASIGATNLREVQRMIPMPLQAGDAGVKSIASATLSATTGTAGNWGLTLAKRLCTLVPSAMNGMSPADFAALAMPQVDSGAAIMVVALASATTLGFIDANLVIGEK